MKFSIKALKYSEFMSEETHAFEAKLYKDGKLFALVGNRGHGGNHDIYPAPNTRGLWDEINNNINPWLAKNYPRSSEYPELEPDLEWVITDLVNKTLALKEINSTFKRRIKKFMVLGVDENGEEAVYSYKKAFNAEHVSEFIRITKIPKDKIMNLMPDDEAKKLYARHVFDFDLDKNAEIREINQNRNRNRIHSTFEDFDND